MTEQNLFASALIVRRGNDEQNLIAGATENKLPGWMDPKSTVYLSGRGKPHLEIKGAAELAQLQDLMKQTAISSSREPHELMGQGVREPIRLLARYKEWTQFFYSPWTLGYAEDNAIPIDQPIGSAFVSSPEGRAMFITPGVQQWVRPSFFEVKGNLRVYWREPPDCVVAAASTPHGRDRGLHGSAP